MPELIATATATSILGVVGKAAGTVSRIGPVKDWLHGCKVRTLAGRLTPRNHDLVKGVRTAHICALDHVARGYTSLLTTLPGHETGSDDHAFANNLRAFIDARLKILSDQSIDHDVLGAEEINDVLEHLATATTHQSYADLNRKSQIDCEARALEEITRDAGRTPPALFVRLFKGENEGAGWYEAFSLFVTEELKTNERFRSIFFATEFADIRGMLNELVDQKRTEFPDLSGFMTDVKHQLNRIQDKLDKIQNSVNENNELAAQLVKQLNKNEELHQKLEAANVTQQKIMAIARRTALNINDPEQALKELESHAEIAIEVEKEGRGSSNLGAFVDAVLARVREKYDVNDFDAAAKEADEGFAEWEQREAERRTESLQAGLKILESGLNQDILRRNAASAASRIARICELKHSDTPSDQLNALDAAYNEWFESGRDAGLNFDLEVAAEIAVLERNRASGQRQRGYWHNNLGSALVELGTRQSGTESLEHAIAELQLAIQQLGQGRAPLEWAAAKNNLGNAFYSLGQRDSGTGRLELAVAAYQSALEEYKQDRAPLEWAAAKNNLGNALLELGLRESGTERFEQAIAAYQSALKEYKQDRAPLEWAAAKNNLGNALFERGVRERETKWLEQSIDAYQSALLEYKRDHVPLEWAMTQTNLGKALSTLGSIENGTERLEQAVTACQSALLEHRRDRVPLEWARTQHQLGTVLLRLGERESGTELLELAVAAYQSALEEYRQDRLPLYWAATLTNQAIALCIISERRSDLALAKTLLIEFGTAIQTSRQAGQNLFSDISEETLQKARSLVTKLEHR